MIKITSLYEAKSVPVLGSGLVFNDHKSCDLEGRAGFSVSIIQKENQYYLNFTHTFNDFPERIYYKMTAIQFKKLVTGYNRWEVGYVGA